MKEEPADSAGEAEETVQITAGDDEGAEGEEEAADNSRDLVTPDMGEEEEQEQQQAEVKTEAGLYDL